MRNRPENPLAQQVKGALILREGEEIATQTHNLMVSLNCQVLTTNNSRMMVKATRGNLQSIKKCWLAKDERNTLSQELNVCISQIVIFGNA